MYVVVFSIINEIFMVFLSMTYDSDTHPPKTNVIISFVKEIMFWNCYLPTLWQIVIKFTVFFLDGFPKFYFHKYVCRVVWAPSVTYLPMHNSIPVETSKLKLCSPSVKFPHVRPRVIVWWPLIAGQGGAVSGLTGWLTFCGEWCSKTSFSRRKNNF